MFPVARQVGADHRALTAALTRREVRSAAVMTSRYKGLPQVTIGPACSAGGEIPTHGRLGASATPRHASGSVVSMIEIRALTKRYGTTTAVSDLTFTVRPGTVTGFLGPNGAGKSTTMRMILGLDEPTSGSVLVNGRPPRGHAAPLREVGGMLDPRAVLPSRSAYNHLLALAQTSGIRRSRVDEVIDAVGLHAVAGRRAGKFSLGMGQRLGIAAALLGDPATVILDEPVNGLDVEGIRWIRALLHDLAARGKTVFVSSHLMSEIAQTATHLIVIGRGRLIADTGVAEFIASAAPPAVRVRSSDQSRLAELLRSPGVTVVAADGGALAVSGLPAAQIGAAAAAAGITVLELATEQTSLEDAFMDLTGDAVEFRAAARPDAGPAFEEEQ
jgi:ABC-2 type transport system ATP-binding protein